MDKKIKKMKRLRFIGVAVAAILLFANLTACSNDDDNGGGGTKGKRLIKAEYDYSSISFFYDDQGRLIEARQVYTEDGRTYNHTFNWNDNSIKESWDGEYRVSYFLENGLVRREQCDGSSYYFKYNMDGRFTHYNSTKQAEWEDDRLVLWYTGDVYITYTYDNFSCKKGYLPPIFLFDSPLYMAHPEIFGLKTNKLPSASSYNIDDSGRNIRNSTYEYEFKNGYVTKIIEKRKETKDGSDYTLTFKLTWK